MSQPTEDLETNEYAYITTLGRVSGDSHRIEIWFVVINGVIWVASGGMERSDWVRNLMADPSVSVEIGDARWEATATPHPKLAHHLARERLAGRYQAWTPGKQLSKWASDSLLIELVPGARH